MQETDPVKEINHYINWYSCLPKGYNNVSDLMHARRVLSTHLARIGEMVGDVREQYLVADATRENERYTRQQKYFVENGSTGMEKAEVRARAETSKLLLIAAQAEGTFRKHEKQMYSIQVVLDSLNQDIAIARDEYARKNYANPT